MPRPPSLAAMRYYVEFHARLGVLSTGHTYLVYGRQDANGTPLEQHVVGFYALAGLLGNTVGMVAFPGRVGQKNSDGRMPDVAVFRHDLTAAQYARLMSFIAQEQGKSKVWNLFVNNCNDFAADAALAIGLKPPTDRFVLPGVFVRTLREMNT